MEQTGTQYLAAIRKHPESIVRGGCNANHKVLELLIFCDFFRKPNISADQIPAFKSRPSNFYQPRISQKFSPSFVAMTALRACFNRKQNQTSGGFFFLTHKLIFSMFIVECFRLRCYASE